MGTLPDGPAPVTPPGLEPTPRPSRRTRRTTSVVPRSFLALVTLTAVALSAVVVGPRPSNAARLGPPAPRTLVVDGTVSRGCRAPVDPTPVPTAVPSGAPSADPSVAPSAAPSADPSSVPSAAPSIPPDPSVDPSTPPVDPSPSAAPSVEPTAPPTPAPTRTPRPTPTPYIPPGIDVSVWNGSLDYAPIVEKGMRFVIIKATQGADITDSRFLTNAERARAAGLLVGAYHFFDYTSDGVAQADHFVETVQAAGLLTDALPLAVDVECLERYGWAEWAETQPRLRALIDRLYELTGRKPILYTSKQMWRQVMGDDPTFGDLPLWVACWRCDKPILPVGWRSWRFWQIRPYTFPALGKSLDGDVFRGTDATLETWRGAPILINNGERVTDERDLLIDISQFDGIEVRTADAGDGWGEWQAWAPIVRHRLAPGDGSRRVNVQLRNADGVEGPVLSDAILLDQSPPQLGLPRVSVRTDATIGTGGSVPVRVTWTATDAVAGMGSSVLVHDCGVGLGGETLAGSSGAAARATTPRRRITITEDTTPAIDGTLVAGECSLTVRGQDAVGNRAEPGAPTRVSLRIDDLAALVLRLSTGWTTRLQSGAVGGSVLRAATTGATIRATVQGDGLAIIATKGPRAGRLKVVLDGALVTVADLYAPVLTVRSVVASLPLPPGPHTLRLTVLPTRNPLSKGRRADVDALVVHQATDPVPPDPTPDPSPAPPADPSPAPPVDPSPAP